MSLLLHNKQTHTNCMSFEIACTQVCVFNGHGLMCVGRCCLLIAVLLAVLFVGGAWLLLLLFLLLLPNYLT